MAKLKFGKIITISLKMAIPYLSVFDGCHSLAIDLEKYLKTLLERDYKP